MPSPVFISYARGASLAHAQALKNALGDLAFLDTVAIKDGEDFPDRILNGLLDASVVVIFATGLYLDRLYCRIEMRLALQGGAHIVLPLGDGCQDVLDALDTVISRKNWPHANETDRIVNLVHEALKNNPRPIRERLSKDVGRRIAKAFQEEAEIPQPQQRPDNYSFPVGIASSIGSRFVGRANLLRSIHRTLSAGKGQSAQLTVSV